MENIQNLIDEYNSIKDLKKDIGIVYHLLDELGIPYRPTNCRKCQQDLKMIVAEELGIIGDAAEVSSFDTPEGAEYVYLLDRSQSWNGHIISQDTPVEVIREFVKVFPKGYFKKVEK